MKRLIYCAAALSVLLMCSCGEDFLSTENLYEKGLENFYQKPADIEEAIAGVYNATYAGDALSEEHIVTCLLSDLMLGGGGADDITAKNADSFIDPLEDTHKDMWVQTYNGVYRCNAIIESLTDADLSGYFESEAEAMAFTNQSLGEAYFMRGFFMFRAAKWFGGLPIIPTTDSPRDVARSTFTETFTVIASDIKMGVELMTDESAATISSDQYGHANKWIAEGYLSRVYQFYTGYMTNIEGSATTELPLRDGSLSKSDVITMLEDCINNSGYALLSDFRNLWPYSYMNERAGDTILPWAATEELKWAGQDGFNPTFGTGNTEVMFAQRYSFGNWSWSNAQGATNRAPLFFGIRDNSMVPFGQGWGWAPVNPILYNQWDDADQRKQGSILELGSEEQATSDGYVSDKGDHETGFVCKKYTSLQHDGDEGTKGLFYYLYGVTGVDYQLWHAQDFYYMRFSDIYLMHAELAESAASLNIVRKRAGYTDDIAYSLDALKEERMHEFAFEGIRWYDLVRWGDVNNNSNNLFDNEIDVSNSGLASKYSVAYPQETKGLRPIPESEIRLSNGAYTQNPGW